MTETSSVNGRLGTTGASVSDNIARLREAAHWSYRELGERLEAIGRPIPTIGLRRIESGDRRVDADELVALAIVFGVTPNRLLMPPDAEDQVDVLTAAPTASARDAWLWLAGEYPLPQDIEAPAESGLRRGAQLYAIQKWRKDNRPWEDVDADAVMFEDFARYTKELTELAELAERAQTAGLAHSVMLRWLDLKDHERRQRG